MSHFFLGLAYLDLGQQAAAKPHLQGFLETRGEEAADWAIRRARELVSGPVVAAGVRAGDGHDG